MYRSSEIVAVVGGVVVVAVVVMAVGLVGVDPSQATSDAPAAPSRPSAWRWLLEAETLALEIQAFARQSEYFGGLIVIAAR